MLNVECWMLNDDDDDDDDDVVVVAAVLEAVVNVAVAVVVVVVVVVVAAVLEAVVNVAVAVVVVVVVVVVVLVVDVVDDIKNWWTFHFLETEVDLVQQYQQSIEDQTLAVPYSKTWLWQCYPYVITRGPWPIRFGDSAKKFPCFHFSTDFLGLQTSTLRFTASNITLANWC